MQFDSTNIPYGYCQCGCGQQTTVPTINQGKRRRGVPMQFMHGHNRRRKDPEYRIEDTGYETPCWIWQHGAYPDGYGKLCHNSIYYRAHRYYYEQEHGPIPEGHDVHHLCSQPLCVRPSHMATLEHAKHQSMHARKRAKLTPNKVRLARQLLSEGTPVTHVAKRLGVHMITIQAMRDGRTWKDVT